MFKRREVSTIEELAREDIDGDEKSWHKLFKDYEPGYCDTLMIVNYLADQR